MRRKFVESRGFSADRLRLERAGQITHEDVVELEQRILADPGAGDLVPGTGGLRKIRMRQRGVRRGKSGGARVYYLDLSARGITHLLALFGKRERSDLSQQERLALAPLVAQLKKEEKP